MLPFKMIQYRHVYKADLPVKIAHSSIFKILISSEAY